MILFDNRTDFEISGEILATLKSIAQSVTNRNIELLLVSDDEIRALNAEFLGRDYATDVLSFPLDSSEMPQCHCETNRRFAKAIHLVSSEFGGESGESCVESSTDSPNQMPNLPLGSIVISLEMAQSVADSQNHSLQNELAILFTHGLLHLLGYDHESDSGEHRKKESEILARFGIETTLISRNS